MEIKIIIRNLESNRVKYTFTKDEVRLKFSKIEDFEIVEFAKKVTKFLEENNQQISLRSDIQTRQNNGEKIFSVLLRKANKKQTKVYYVEGNKDLITKVLNLDGGENE